MLGWVLDAVALAVSSERCAACDAPVPLRRVFCPPCAAAVLPAPPSAVRAGPCASIAAALLYGGPIAVAIGRFKYEGRVDLARPLGGLLRRLADGPRGEGRAGGPPPCDVIVPVPLHALRLAERGFNQAALLARPLARALARPLRPLALARTQATQVQASLHRRARQGNVRGAFTVRDSGAVRGARVLLVDDVATTGKTLDACADALLGAGARSVHAAVLARVS